LRSVQFVLDAAAEGADPRRALCHHLADQA
jgi:hypothetical protein